MIYEMKTYADEQNRIIQSRRPLVDCEPGVPAYSGPEEFFAVGVLQFNHPVHGPASKQFPFPVTPATTILEAYAVFPLCFEQAKTKCEAELRAEINREQSKLILSKAMPGNPKTRFQ